MELNSCFMSRQAITFQTKQYRILSQKVVLAFCANYLTFHTTTDFHTFCIIWFWFVFNAGFVHFLLFLMNLIPALKKSYLQPWTRMIIKKRLSVIMSSVFIYTKDDQQRLTTAQNDPKQPTMTHNDPRKSTANKNDTQWPKK